MAKPKELDPQKIVSLLNKKWPPPNTCSICNKNDWYISKTIYELRGFYEGNLTIGGPVFPVVAVSCNVCGHTLFFNAIKLGIVQLPTAKEVSNDA